MDKNKARNLLKQLLIYIKRKYSDDPILIFEIEGVFTDLNNLLTK